MEPRPGLKDCLFSAETQKCLIQRIIDYVKQKGVVKATPLFGTIPPEEPSFNVSGHQTSQNFLKDQSECTIDESTHVKRSSIFNLDGKVFLLLF